MSIAEAAVEGVWDNIASVCYGKKIYTPTEKSWFSVAEVKQDKLAVTTSNDNMLPPIHRDYFVNALAYLLAHNHTKTSPCEIRSNKVYEEAGPLCRSARAPGSGQMNITYVLPILAEMGLVGIGKDVPSSAWLIA